MASRRFLTGITTSGTPHLGNYVGAIRPALAASETDDTDGFYFLADYHALVKHQDPERLRRSRLEIASTWLAFGLDPERVTFYRQSDIHEIPELAWILTTLTAKGLMNRAHAYKALVQENETAGVADPDRGITMGLFSYPILMAADILVFRATHVPVGRDQIQHLEMTRDIAQRFNHHYGERLVLPDVVVQDEGAVLTGLDGRKMSKSYENTIPLFAPAKTLRKSVMRIVTNSQAPGEPKDPATSTIFELYRAFATPDATREFHQAFVDGIAWGEAKQQLFECLESQLAEPRERYDALMAQPERVESILQAGAEKARATSRAVLDDVRRATGIAA